MSWYINNDITVDIMTTTETIETSSEGESLPITVVHRAIPALAGVNMYQLPLSQYIYVEAGVLSVIHVSGRYFVPAKHGIIIPPQTEHQLLAKTAVTLSIYQFDDEQAVDLALSLQVSSVSPFLSALILESKNITQNYLWNSPQGRLFRTIRDGIVVSPKIDTFLPYPKDERLTNITDKLLLHPSLKSDLVSWGKFVKASSRTLTRVFKKETGITYSEWRQRLNVQIAIKHLAQGDSINSIAKLLGYESSSAFIYMFKKQMAISPKQFLK